MTALIAETETRCLGLAQPSVRKGSHCAITLPSPIAHAFVVGPENWPLFELFHPESISLLCDRAPIVLVGASGAGKTTAAAGLLGAWSRETPSRKFTITSAVEFSRALTRAIKSDDMQRFRQQHRDCDGLMIDNLHEFVGKPVAQEEFCATLEHLLSQGKLVIATASDLPLLIPGLSKSIQSRFSGGLSVSIAIPSATSRKLLLENLAAHAQLGFEPSDLEPLTSQIQEDRTALELRGLLIRWSHQLRLNPSVASKPQRIVDRILGASTLPNVSANEIAKTVAKEMRVPVEQLVGPSRKSSVVRARGLAILLIRQLTSDSYESIGSFFAGRDHTTVMHAFKKTESELSLDMELNRVYDRVRRKFSIPR